MSELKNNTYHGEVLLLGNQDLTWSVIIKFKLNEVEYESIVQVAEKPSTEAQIQALGMRISQVIMQDVLSKVMKKLTEEGEDNGESS